MVCNSKIAESRGMIKKDDLNRLINLLKKVGLPTDIRPEVKQEAILRAIKNDKKSFHNRIPLILPKDIGEVEISYEWSGDDLKFCYK